MFLTAKEKREALRNLAAATAWSIKERTMRAQFEELVLVVRDGRPAVTQFSPIAQEDVDTIYESMLIAADFLSPAV